jgi:SAM-dependent methyltransferase
VDYISNGKDYLLYQQYLKEKGVFDYDKNHSYWGNVPITSPVLKPLYKIFKQGMKFLDLGCGAGNVLRFADNIGYNVKGIEFNAELLKYTGAYKTEIKDIRELDENIYSTFDVIYTYRPLKLELEEYLVRVIQNMKTGSFIITPDFKIKNKRVELIDSFTYKINK